MSSSWWYRDGYGDVRLWVVLLITFVALASIVVGVVLGIARPVDRASCAGYGRATGLPVKFVDYAFGSWDCLEYVHGHWQPKGNDVAVTPR